MESCFLTSGNLWCDWDYTCEKAHKKTSNQKKNQKSLSWKRIEDMSLEDPKGKWPSASVLSSPEDHSLSWSTRNNQIFILSVFWSPLALIPSSPTNLLGLQLCSYHCALQNPNFLYFTSSHRTLLPLSPSEIQGNPLRILLLCSLCWLNTIDLLGLHTPWDTQAAFIQSLSSLILFPEQYQTWSWHDLFLYSTCTELIIKSYQFCLQPIAQPHPYLLISINHSKANPIVNTTQIMK